MEKLHTISKPGFWAVMVIIMTSVSIHKALTVKETLDIVLCTVAAVMGIGFTLHYVADKILVSMFGGGEDDV